MAKVTAQEELIKVQRRGWPTVGSVRQQSSLGSLTCHIGLHVWVVRRISSVVVDLIKENRIGELRIDRARVVAQDREGLAQVSFRYREHSFKINRGATGDWPLARSGALDGIQSVRLFVHKVQDLRGRRKGHATNSLVAGFHAEKLGSRFHFLSVDRTSGSFSIKEPVAIGVQRHTRGGVDAGSEVSLNGAFVDAVLKGRERIGIHGVFSPCSPGVFTAVSMKSNDFVFSGDSHKKLPCLGVDHHTGMDTWTPAGKGHIREATDRSNGVVHASWSVGLLKVVSHKLSIFLIASGVECPVDSTPGSSCFGVVGPSDASGCLVKHIRMQEVALFVRFPLCSHSIYSIAVLW